MKDTLIIIIKLIINTLFSNIILFINNYFNNLKLTVILKVKEIAICKIIKSNRKDLLNLLVKMKKQFFKDISYGVFAAMI